MIYIYKIDLIHRIHDWDVSFTFPAPNARQARVWAMLKLAQPGYWLVTKARRLTAKNPA